MDLEKALEVTECIMDVLNALGIDDEDLWYSLADARLLIFTAIEAKEDGKEYQRYVDLAIEALQMVGERLDELGIKNDDLIDLIDNAIELLIT